MIDSPMLSELMTESNANGARRIILGILGRKFGPVPPDLSTALIKILDADRLQQLAESAAVSPDLESFRRKNDI